MSERCLALAFSNATIINGVGIRPDIHFTSENPGTTVLALYFCAVQAHLSRIIKTLRRPAKWYGLCDDLNRLRK